MKMPPVLSDLSAEHYEHMVRMLAMGRTDVEIATSLHDDLEIAVDVKKEVLVRAVNRWRKGKGNESALLLLAQKMVNKTGSLRRQVDVILEMSVLVDTQKVRVKKMLDKEADTPLLLQTATEEMKVLFTMLNQLGKMHMDTGLLRKVKAGETLDNYTDYQDAEPEVAEALYTEEERRLVLIAYHETEG